MGTRNTGVLTIALQIATGEFEKGIKGITTKLGTLERSCAKAGFAMSAAFTAPLAGLGKHAITSFREFDKAINAAMADMALSGEGVGDIYNKLSQRAVEVAIITGKSAQDIAESYRVIISAGYNGEQALAHVGPVAMLAKNAYMSTAEAARALLTTQTALMQKSDDVAQSQANLVHIQDVLTAAYLSAPAQLSEFTASLGSSLSGMMTTYKMSMEDATAMLIGLAEAAVKGVKSSTQMGMIITQITNKSIKNSKAWEDAHIAAYDKVTHKLRPIPKILADIEKAMQSMDDPQRTNFLVNVLGFDQRTIKAILPVLSRGQSILSNAKKLSEEAAGLSVKLLSEQMKSFDFALNEMKVRWESVMRSIGEAEAPILIGFLNIVNSIGEAFMGLSPKMKGVIVASGAILAALGPLAFIIHAIILALSPWVVAVGAIAVSSVAIYTYWDDISGAIQKAYAYAAGYAAEMAKAATGTEVQDGYWTRFANNYADIIISVVEWLEKGTANALSNIWDSFKTLLSMLYDATVDWITQLTVALKDYWVRLVAELLTIWDKFGEAFPQLADRAEELWRAIKDSASHYLDIIIAKVNATIDRLLEMGGLLTIRQGISSLWAAVGSATSGDANAAGVAAAAEAEKQWAEAIKKRAEEEKKAREAKAKDRINQLLSPDGKPLPPPVSSGYNPNAGDSGGFFPDINNGKTKTKVNEVAKAMDDLQEKLAKIKEDDAIAKLNDDLEQSIKNQDKLTFNELTEKIRQSTYNGAMIGLEDMVEKTNGAGLQLAMDFSTEKAEIKVTELQDKYAEAGRAAAKETGEKLKEAYKEGVDFWRGLFENAITGTTFNLQDALKQIAVGFAAEIANALMGNLGGLFNGVKSPQDFGGLLGNLVFGGTGTGSSGILGQMGLGEDGLLGAIGLGSMSGLMGGLGGGAGMLVTNAAGVTSTVAAGSAVAAGSTVTGSAMMPATGVLGALGPYGIAAVAALAIGGMMFGDDISGMFSGGATNPETLARKSFDGWIEEQFKKLKQVSFLDSGGKMQNFDTSKLNFVTGKSDKFNNSDWIKEMETWGSKATDTFQGLGIAIAEVAGITEDIGGQIGYLLGSNLGGSIDNARLLVMQLGLSFDDLQGKLLEMAKSSEITWHEYNVYVQGVTEAFKPGLEAIGAYGQAFNNLINSGGKGEAALKSFRDVAVEGLEAGVKTIDQLKAKMLSEATTDAEKKKVEAMFDAAKQRGISTLEAWKDSTDAVAGSIVGDMYALNQDLAKTWDEMTTKIGDLTDALSKIPESITSKINLEVDANLSDDARKVLDSGTATGINLNNTTTGKSVAKFAKGGIFKGPTLFTYSGGFGLGGEAGGEGILPLGEVNGKLGVHAKVGNVSGAAKKEIHLHIDARGADAGVEDRLMEAIAASENRILELVD